MTTPTTPKQAREISDVLVGAGIAPIVADSMRSLAAQVEALTAAIVERDSITKGLLFRIEALTGERDALLAGEQAMADEIKALRDDCVALKADAARFCTAIARDDNAEWLYGIVIGNAPDKAAIRAEFDEAMAVQP